MQPSDLQMYAVCMHDMPLKFASQTNMQVVIANACKLTIEQRTFHEIQGHLLDDEGHSISMLN